MEDMHKTDLLTLQVIVHFISNAGMPYLHSLMYHYHGVMMTIKVDLKGTCVFSVHLHHTIDTRTIGIGNGSRYAC